MKCLIMHEHFIQSKVTAEVQWHALFLKLIYYHITPPIKTQTSINKRILYSQMFFPRPRRVDNAQWKSNGKFVQRRWCLRTVWIISPILLLQAIIFEGTVLSRWNTPVRFVSWMAWMESSIFKYASGQAGKRTSFIIFVTTMDKTGWADAQYAA